MQIEQTDARRWVDDLVTTYMQLGGMGTSFRCLSKNETVAHHCGTFMAGECRGGNPANTSGILCRVPTVSWGFRFVSDDPPRFLGLKERPIA